MAGIAGIDSPKPQTVSRMLDRLTHRGGAGSKIVEHDGVTLGAVWPEAHTAPTPRPLRRQAAWDGDSPPLPDPESLEREPKPYALAIARGPQRLLLARDPFGICPLYYGRTTEGELVFASEVKALLQVTEDIREFPPGTWYTRQDGFQPMDALQKMPAMPESAAAIADDLRLRLEHAVCRHIKGDEAGAWLSGGLDSSAIVALARPHVRALHTFAAGMDGAPDLRFAQEIADYFETNHHSVVVTLQQTLDALPDVIYHLESFDALLVRSAVTNYLVAQHAANYTEAAFSGEGADELFAGYGYLRELPADKLAHELHDLTGRLHNTALQRVDRSAAAHGLVVHIPFLSPEVVTYALGISPDLKLRRSRETTEKWILRKALEHVLPDSVLWRRKTKFWQGTGIGELLEQYGERSISGADYAQEHRLANGWVLNTKEELLYYRLFREHFGDLPLLDWMGRTKGAPRRAA